MKLGVEAQFSAWLSMNCVRMEAAFSRYGGKSAICVVYRNEFVHKVSEISIFCLSSWRLFKTLFELSGKLLVEFCPSSCLGVQKCKFSLCPRLPGRPLTTKKRPVFIAT